jgi:deoxyribonuclease-4
MFIIGSHVSLGGKEQFLGSVKEALSYGANAFMVYTGAPQNTKRMPLETMFIEPAKQLMNSANILSEHVIVHAPYIVNLANPDPEKQNFAVEFLTTEVLRTEALGSHVMVLHPGAHMGDGAILGIERIAKGVNAIIKASEGSKVIIALEGMAGKGTEVGRNFNELRAMIDKIEDQSRIGICFDTCHTHDAGYDIINDFEGVLKAFDDIVGLKFLKVIHINDSKNDRDAHKDRHANLGFGYIGFDVIDKIVHHPLLETIPKILETPYVEDALNPDISYPPYRYEIEMLKNRQFNPLLLDIIRDQKGGLS